MEKILVIEDDTDIVYLMGIHIKDLGYEFDAADNGIQGLEMARMNPYVLIILDVMLPGLDGLSVCSTLRSENITTPIMMLTARAEEFDKVNGLESGADDYLTKPFGVREFSARVKAIIRRESRKAIASDSQTSEQLTHGDLVIDLKKRKVFLANSKVVLTPKEYEVLLLLAQNPGQFFTREQLLKQVWGYDFTGYDHTVSSHINRLRAKIEKDMSQPKYILTSWSVGYCFNDELIKTHE
jgi:two-component system, OmpR family, alkaline phosphatase synthesis response regulator PhoP